MWGLEDGPYNVAVFLIPADDDVFMACPAESASISGDIEDLPAIYPELWNGNAQPRLWDIEKVIVDMEKSPNFAIGTDAREKYAEEGVSHVAVLESHIVRENSTPFRFGGNEIKGNSVMVLYSADRNKYRLFHCLSCAYTFAKWLEEKQGTWRNAASIELQEARKSLN